MADISVNTDQSEDITVTIRMEAVVERINAFIAEKQFSPQIANFLFNKVYHAQCLGILRVNPDKLLYDEKLVIKSLETFKLEDLANAPPR